MTAVFATSGLHPEVAEYLRERTTLQVASSADADTLTRESATASIIIVRDPIPERIFGTHHCLRGLVRHGAGLDMIPMEAATRAGVPVVNVPGVNAASVAEHAIMTMLVLRRRLQAVGTLLHTAGWKEARALGSSGHALQGSTVGLVGTGHVGEAVRNRLQHWDVQLLGHNRSGAFPAGVHPRGLDALLAESDVLVLACPLTEATRGLIGSEELKLMKPTAVLVNVARGPVVDEAALLDALLGGRLAGAALDVFTEQPLPPGHPYLALNNVVLTPHIAGGTDDDMRNIGRAAAQAALQLLRGEAPPSLVNPQVLNGPTT